MTAIQTEWHPTFERDPIRVEIVETGWAPWYRVFRYHHYLHDAKQMPFSTAFTGFDLATGAPVAFVGMSGMVVTRGKGRIRAARACRLVVHPEYQGAGVGMRFLEEVCQREADGVGFIGKPVPTYLHTAHPALCAAMRRSPRWRQVSQMIAGAPSISISVPSARYGGHTRSVAGFKYLGQRKAS